MAQPAVQTFGKYQILERIATGGTAEIYKAKLEGIGGFQRTFAIKRILPNLSQHSDYIAMLVDEAKVAGLLSHANIVQILDLGQVDGMWYIAMEFVDGRDLGAVLRRANRKGLCLPVPHAVFITIELLKGLEYAHQRQVMRGGKAVPLNIIHRDISPPNILLSFQGEVKLTDFGIARASLKMMETVSGIVKGRFDYMSPEQAEAKKDLDQRSDLFTVGVILYQTLTGVHPFRAESEIGTVERVRQGTYTPLATRNPEIPFALQTIVDRALQVDPNKRYPSATAFKEALDRFFHDSGFIFTHATLATYVKGLFPEAQKKRARKPGTPTGGLVRADPPTQKAIQSYGEPPTDVAATPPGALTREELEPTALRANPLTADTIHPPAATNLSASRAAVDHDEVATVIRTTPFQPGELDAIESPLYEPSTISEQTRPAVIGWLGALLSVLFLVIGLLLGLTLAGGGAYLMGLGVQPSAPPIVRILSQREVTVLLDGEPAPESFSIPANVRKNLEVRANEYAWSIPLQMAEGEVRVFVIQIPNPTTTPE